MKAHNSLPLARNTPKDDLYEITRVSSLQSVAPPEIHMREDEGVGMALAKGRQPRRGGLCVAEPVRGAAGARSAFRCTCKAASHIGENVYSAGLSSATANSACSGLFWYCP